MKIANERTLDELDRLKDQLTAHLRKSPSKQKPVKNPFNGRFRWVMPLFLMGGGGYLFYRNTPTLKEYMLESGNISYQQSLAWSAIETYLRIKWFQLTSAHALTPSSTLANHCYITRLESDLIFLTERSPEKKLHIETWSSLSMGLLSWGNNEKIRYINNYGDLVERQRTSKLMVGDFIRIWGKTTEKLIKRERVFSFYERELPQIGSQCETVNWLAKWELSSLEHASAVEQCKANSRKVSEKLKQVVEERLKRQKKLYKQ